MIDLIEITARCLQKYSDKKIAVGVSGGRDSMCLLYAVINCGAIAKDNIFVVHVNHRLREEADADEKFVRDYCNKIGVRFGAYCVDVRGESARKSLTIEQAARNLRYDIFYDVIKTRAADVVLTAHHAYDNAESVLMHLFRGAGLDGLCGMREQSGILLRPFIEVYPSELDEFCKKNGIEYVVDKTNFEDDADRNFLRLRVMPIIEQRYCGATRAINEFSRECGNAVVALDGMLDRRLISTSDGAVRVADEALSTPLASRYVREALRFFSLTDVTRAMTERAVELYDKRTGAVVELNNGVVAAREYDGIALYVPRLACTNVVPAKLGANFIDGLAVDIYESNAPANSVRGGAVDMDKLDGAVIRFRRDGDMFEPFGGVRKKLSRFFIDGKVPSRLRDRTPLICCGDEVLVVVGMQISNSVRQTENTLRRAVVRLRK